MSAYLTLAIHELVWRMDDAADGILTKHLGIDYVTARLLMTLQQNQPMTQRHLATKLGITPAAVTKSLPRFVGAGWVVVTVDPAQPRRNFARLTDKGEALATRCWEILEGAFAELLRERNLDGHALMAQINSLVEGLSCKENV